ncbi:amidase domain-containing protein [Virgibacillus xinjiangensis]|uniref:Amidase domain-containing protein n=1 Tax=Virgibacillus xinjiangensis TaxID=393090 RepID=A0ABV7CQV4_9BACI
MEALKKEWLRFFSDERNENSWWLRKKALWKNRGAEIVRIHGQGERYRQFRYDGNCFYRYLLHHTFLIKQKDRFHVEELVIPYEFRWINGKVEDHREVPKNPQSERKLDILQRGEDAGEYRFTYDRMAAVQYAERWWNSYNPAYRTFDVDCTNYVSQCLRAGGAPMHGQPARDRGWWYSGDNWSYSWAVAHSLRWYLSGSTKGLQGREVESAEELLPGDIICYDFQGDGRWDHNTIVVAKDAHGMPLVNAHTDNSRNRYWSYEDSTAWTPEITYKFFRIGAD